MRFTLLICTFIAMACQPKSNQMVAQKNSNSKIETIEKSESEWRAELNDAEFRVLRKAGTERAFSGDLWDHKGDGVYTCRGCQLPLFDSKTKFKSGTGWPSYYKPFNDVNVGEDTDYKIGYARTEVHCARCGGHLGHVFNDGPEPTGLRYCINSVSLDFVERDSVPSLINSGQE
ncbi:MAG: peptide-methionine (R)-S-oxide reductase MsrB [Saprospiraceae bacterium]|nr:peptide-methionine (R)-S-oxide reductase MsrB [Saprospiraceae bacterium]